MGPSIRTRIRLSENSRKHALDVLPHISIREPQRSIAANLVNSVAAGVALGVVRISVDLYDQSFLGAKEVDDAVPDHMLPPKLITQL